MDRWQAQRIKDARASLDAFILRCDAEMAAWERRRGEARKARASLSSIDDFPGRART